MRDKRPGIRIRLFGIRIQDQGARSKGQGIRNQRTRISGIRALSAPVQFTEPAIEDYAFTNMKISKR